HQPAPRRYRDIAGRDPSVMADIDRSSQEREKNTDNDKPQGTAPRPGHCSGQNALWTIWCRRQKRASAMLLLVWSPCLEIEPRRAPQARPECRKGNPKKSNLWTGSLVLAEGLRGLEHGYTHTPNISRDRLQGRHGREPGP